MKHDWPTISAAEAEAESEVQREARKPLREEIEALIAPWQEANYNNDDEAANDDEYGWACLEMEEEYVVRGDDVAEDGFGKVDYFQDLEQEEDVGGYRHRKYEQERPPFSPGELIVMAIICSDTAYVDRDTIHHWITESVPYYRLHARNPSRTMGGGSLGDLGFSDVLWNAEIPLVCKRVFDEDENIPKGANRVSWSTKPCQARMYLRRWLEPVREGGFRFLDLPAELRNRVYEELLVYPGPALDIDHKGWGCRVSNRVCDSEDHPAKFRRYWYSAEPPAKTLQLLLASKQIYREAMPVYYGLNKFKISNQYKLCEVLGALSADRLRHIKNIEVGVCWHYDHSDDGKGIRPADPTTATSISLDKLRICHDDDCIYSQMKGSFTKPRDFAQVDNMKFITALAVRAKEVDTFVPCIEERRNWTETGGKKLSDVFHQFFLDQVQQAGSNTKVMSSTEENGS